ncbi:MAG: histidine kinase dimerization/phosphoacceptor domain-containing protein, partial [Nocardiaceae bacterium]|nr:histidine kinase dimerization/phosphoacceptor domain-containing protein [Nocardiaceae bacterium]
MTTLDDPTTRQRWGRFGVVFAAVWLVFLVEPLSAGWNRHDVRGWTGIALTITFAAYYLWVFNRARQVRVRRTIRPPLARAVVDVATLAVLGTAMTVTLGEPGLASTVYVAVTAVMMLPAIAGGAIALGVAAVVELLATQFDWNVSGLPLAICAAAFAMAGVIALMNRNLDLLNRREEDERRAVQEERTRMARDLHDILGHSLTVITVKAQLANRLIDVDVDRARTELD